MSFRVSPGLRRAIEGEQERLDWPKLVSVLASKRGSKIRRHSTYASGGPRDAKGKAPE